MGNKVSSPFPTFETATAHLNEVEIVHLRGIFKAMSRNRDMVTLQSFVEHAKCSSHARRHVLPRLFQAMDTKRDGVLDFEEYVSAVALFRVGTTEDKIKLLFLMYEPATKTGALPREHFRLMLVDALMLAQREDVVPDDWLTDQLELSQGMVEMALCQYTSAGGAAAVPNGTDKEQGGPGKMDLQEFVSFVKVEGSIQGLLNFLPSVIDV